MMQVLDLFSGIGGFSLGLERTGGFRTVAFCEIDPFCRKVLEKHWPGVPIFEDVRKLTAGDLNDRIDVICGGFPCQPFSCAGKRRGTKDERWLWPEFYRLIREIKPRWVLGENVPGLLSVDSGRVFTGILRDLASSGYDAEWNIISAAGFGAPHLRKRLFILAYPDGFRCKPLVSIQKSSRTCEEGEVGRCGASGRDFSISNRQDTAVLANRRLFQPIIKQDWGAAPTAVCGVDDGIPDWVDRIKALGNAIVPQCVEYIGNCILKSEYTMQNCVEEAE